MVTRLFCEIVAGPDFTDKSTGNPELAVGKTTENGGELDFFDEILRKRPMLCLLCG